MMAGVFLADNGVDDWPPSALMSERYGGYSLFGAPSHYPRPTMFHCLDPWDCSITEVHSSECFSGKFQMLCVLVLTMPLQACARTHVAYAGKPDYPSERTGTCSSTSTATTMPLPPVPDLPDNSALQRFQSFPPDFISPIRRFPANEQAQSLVFDAWEEPDPLRKFRLCQGALAIFPFSVDSFNCIADIYRRYWEDSTSALVAYERALACARLLWSGLENQQEILWGHIEHRPFLRSYHGLAVVNLDLGNSEAAIEQLQFLLRVNPTDNQGCRKLLFSALLDEDRLQEASEVAKKHSDGRDSTDAWFLWGIVLLDYIQFHRGAYSAKVPEESLCLALQSNNFVPELLLSDTPLIQDPDTVSPGSLDEATSYVISSLTSWRRAEGALTWLEELRERGGPKPPDDGAILFNLLTKGRILVKVNNASGADTKIEVTSSLEHMYGQALPEFKLPSGMKDHDPSKIVCFDLDWDASTKFPSFSYDAVEKVYYWEVLNFRKIWKKPKEGRLCSKCYEKATQKCSRCHFAWYCSRQCQVSHWNEGHKRQCKKYVKR